MSIVLIYFTSRILFFFLFSPTTLYPDKFKETPKKPIKRKKVAESSDEEESEEEESEEESDHRCYKLRAGSFLRAIRTRQGPNIHKRLISGHF